MIRDLWGCLDILYIYYIYIYIHNLNPIEFSGWFCNIDIDPNYLSWNNDPKNWINSRLFWSGGWICPEVCTFLSGTSAAEVSQLATLAAKRTCVSSGSACICEAGISRWYCSSTMLIIDGHSPCSCHLNRKKALILSQPTKLLQTGLKISIEKKLLAWSDFMVSIVRFQPTTSEFLSFKSRFCNPNSWLVSNVYH